MEIPCPWVQGLSVYWPEKAAARHGRFIMWHSSPDLCGINRPKPTGLSVTQYFCPGLQIFPTTMTNEAESKLRVGQGTLGCGERWELWEGPQAPEGGKAAQPSPGSRVWRSPHLARATLRTRLGQPDPSLGFLSQHPEAALLKSNRMVHGKFHRGYKACTQTWGALGGLQTLSLTVQVGLFRTCCLSGRKVGRRRNRSA